jgi:hypothetical protein
MLLGPRQSADVEGDLLQLTHVIAGIWRPAEVRGAAKARPSQMACAVDTFRGSAQRKLGPAAVGLHWWCRTRIL